MMKALTTVSFGETPEMRIEERSIPNVRPGFTLVRIHAATVNPLSQLVRSGLVEQATAPLVLSNDGAGTVVEGGSIAPGTPVAIHGGGELGITEDGLQQEWALVEDRRLTPLPKNMSLDEGAALPINYVTAWQAMTRAAQVRTGQVVLISGASGSVGHALIEVARVLGLRPIGIVSSAGKAERALSSGAEAVIDLSSQDVRAETLRLTDGAGADVAFDTVGGSLLRGMLNAVCRRGTVISIGFVGGATGAVDLTDLVVEEKRLQGYDAWLETPEDVAATMETLVQLAGEGRLRPRIDSRFPIEDYAAA